MRTRGLLAVAALGAGLLADPGLAGEEEPPESCFLVTDVADDTAYLGNAATQGYAVQPDVDILSADVASDGTGVSVVFRVQRLDGFALASAPRGSTTYRMEFTGAKRRLFVEALVLAAMPSRGSAGRVGGRAFPATAAIDVLRSEIRVDASRKAFGADAFADGATITRVTVTAVRTYTDQGQLAPGVSGRVTVGDTATTTADYVAGSPTCAAPRVPAEEPEPTTEPTPEPEPTEEPEPTP